MKRTFKVEIRENCKVCGGKLLNNRYRTYCSTKCRQRYYNQKNADKSLEWQRKRRDEIAKTPSKNKCQCLICGRWYIQVATHIYQVHGMTGREYREHFGLEVKKGTVPEWYRKKKGDQALENKTYKNLEKGSKFRFKKGQDGVGAYKRSEITLNRLREQIKKTHKNKAK